jgi:hypothetical protein
MGRGTGLLDQNKARGRAALGTADVDCRLFARALFALSSPTSIEKAVQRMEVFGAGEHCRIFLDADRSRSSDTVIPPWGMGRCVNLSDTLPAHVPSHSVVQAAKEPTKLTQEEEKEIQKIIKGEK